GSRGAIRPAARDCPVPECRWEPVAARIVLMAQRRRVRVRPAHFPRSGESRSAALALSTALPRGGWQPQIPAKPTVMLCRNSKQNHQNILLTTEALKNGIQLERVQLFRFLFANNKITPYRL